MKTITILIILVILIAGYYAVIKYSAKTVSKMYRYKIYKRMLKIAKEDLSSQLENGYYLDGFCNLLTWAGSKVSITNFPELMKYKPDNKTNGHWFGTSPYGKDATKRIDILNEILKNKNL